MTTRIETQEKYKNLTTFKEVQKWLSGNISDKQKELKLRALVLYCEYTHKNPHELYTEYLKDESEQDPMEKQNIAKNQITLWKDWLITEKAISHNSAVTYMGYVLSFYSHTSQRKVFFDKSENKVFKRDKGKKDKPMITIEMVKEIYNATKILRDRAIILCLASSGMPVGDLLDLQWQDIKQDYLNPPETMTIKVDVNRQKNSIRYVTFFSPEARAALEVYFKRELNQLPQNDTDFLFVQLKTKQEDKMNVQLTDHALLQAIKETAKDMTRKLITPYSFRSFFITQMSLAKMQPIYIDVMTAHKVGDVKQAYNLVARPEGHEELRKVYTEHLHAVTILNGNNIKSNLHALEQKQEQTEKQMVFMQQQITQYEQFTGNMFNLIELLAKDNPLAQQQISLLKAQGESFKKSIEKKEA